MPKNRLQDTSLGRLFRTNRSCEQGSRDVMCQEHGLQKTRLVQSLSLGEAGAPDEYAHDDVDANVETVAIQLCSVDLEAEEKVMSPPEMTSQDNTNESSSSTQKKKESAFSLANVRSFFGGYKPVTEIDEKEKASTESKAKDAKDGKIRKYPKFSSSPRAGRYEKISALYAADDSSEDEHQTCLLTSLQ